MSVLQLLMQNQNQPAQTFSTGLESLKGQLDQNRFKEVGRQFVQAWDGTPEGAMQLGKQLGIGPGELQAFMQLGTAFQEYKDKAGPQYESQEYMTPEGIKYRAASDKRNPGGGTIPMGVSEYPKNEWRTQQGADGTETAVGYNPYMRTASPVMGQDQQEIITGRPTPQLVKAITDSGEEVSRFVNPHTENTPWISGIVGDDTREAKIRRLTAIGTPYDVAVKIVDGALRTGTDAEGYSTVHDLTQLGKGQGQGTPAMGGRPGAAPTQPMPGQEQGQDKPWRQQEGFLSSQDLLGGTGPVAKIREKISNVAGPTASPEGGAVFGETLESQNKIKMFNQSVIAGFANNPRVPVAEQNLVKGFLPDPDKFWTDRRGELQKLNNMRDFLERKLGNLDQAINSGDIPRNQYNEFKELKNLIIGTLNMLGNTGLSESGGQGQPTQQQGMPNFETMSDEELDAYLAK